MTPEQMKSHDLQLRIVEFLRVNRGWQVDRTVSRRLELTRRNSEGTVLDAMTLPNEWLDFSLPMRQLLEEMTEAAEAKSQRICASMFVAQRELAVVLLRCTIGLGSLAAGTLVFALLWGGLAHWILSFFVMGCTLIAGEYLRRWSQTIRMVLAPNVRPAPPAPPVQPATGYGGMTN